MHSEIGQILTRVSSLGAPLPENCHSQLDRLCQLVRKHNDQFGLVSKSDSESLCTVHVPDCLSLVPELHGSRGLHLDIGSGGGFPGLVLAICDPERRFVLLERSERKASFLRLAVSTLTLPFVSVCCGEFPREAPTGPVDTVTARAVERPELVAKALTRWLPSGADFLCQSPAMVPIFRKGFHVEHIAVGPLAQFRRGSLWRIRRADTTTLGPSST